MPLLGTCFRTHNKRLTPVPDLSRRLLPVTGGNRADPILILATYPFHPLAAVRRTMRLNGRETAVYTHHV